MESYIDDKKQKDAESRVVTRLIEDEMKQSYLDYAMSVIIGRALPDVRDGLKPVHRRILYAMNDMGMQHNKPYKKSARIVGEVLGKYHPHGDMAVYDTLVRMAQDFSLRYTLIDGQGNFGSVDGDNAAAMRYTEARLAKISDEMLDDIDKETVVFVDNFDGTLKEPTVLPARLPNLLINGSSGIAVGMATNIPPHNLSEICNAIVKVIDNPEIEVKELLGVVKGPDFPTGGIITGKSGILSAYTTGSGKIIVRAKTEIEQKKKLCIVVTEIPYMVNKSQMIEEIVHNIQEKVITDISDIRDESGKEGIRVVIELKKDANPEVVLNQLYKHSSMQTTFGVNMLALVDNQPRVLNLKEMIISFLKHRRNVIIRRTEFDLKKAQEREHIVKGLIIALDDIDRVIEIIKHSRTVEAARGTLIKHYNLSDIQANAILEMKLQRLTSLEQDRLKQEEAELQAKINDLKDILDSEIRVMDIIKSEMNDLVKKFGDARKTEIIEEYEELEAEDLIPEETVVVTITRAGYIKRTPADQYKTQRRGGKGVIATATKDEDFVEDLFVASTHDVILFFTAKGQVHWLKVYQIPETGRYAVGKAVVNLLNIKEDIAAFVPVKEFDDRHFILICTKKGIVKKTSLSAFARPRQGGIKAVTIDPDDSLVNVVMTDGTQKIIVATKEGLAIRFDESDVRPMGRTARGVIGITLKEQDEVVGMVIADDKKSLLTVTENGYGKRSEINEYRLIRRGGHGVINIQCSERNGKVAGILSVGNEDEIMLVSKKGIIIRTITKDISVIGRNTQGIKLMKLENGDKLVAVAKVVDENGA
ncbi:MAG: DNA gyrase subunit A [Candidatus Woesearchaeota archaeon]